MCCAGRTSGVCVWWPAVNCLGNNFSFLLVATCVKRMRELILIPIFLLFIYLAIVSSLFLGPVFRVSAYDSIFIRTCDLSTCISWAAHCSLKWGTRWDNGQMRSVDCRTRKEKNPKTKKISTRTQWNWNRLKYGNCCAGNGTPTIWFRHSAFGSTIWHHAGAGCKLKQIHLPLTRSCASCRFGRLLLITVGVCVCAFLPQSHVRRQCDRSSSSETFQIYSF